MKANILPNAHVDHMQIPSSDLLEKGINTTIQKFHDYLERRKNEKKHEYYKVLSFGWFISIFGLLLTLFGQIIENSTENYFKLFATIGTAGSFSCVIGFLILSTVPYEEVEFDGLINNENYPFRKYFAILCFSFLCIAAGIITILIPPFIGFLFIILGIWVLFPKIIPRVGFTMRIVIGFEIGFIFFGCFMFYMGTDPYGFLNNSFVLKNLDAWISFVKKVKALGTIWVSMYCVLGTIMFLLFFGNCGYFYYFNKKYPEKKGKPTLFLYISVYSWCFAAGVYTMANGVLARYVHIASSATTSIPGYYMYYITHSINMFLPIIINLAFGQKNLFTFTAKLFEYDLKRLQQDGAIMAALAAESTTYLGNTKFFYRSGKNDKDIVKNDTHQSRSNIKGGIERQFWIKAEVISRQETYVESIIRYDVDIDPTWDVKYIKKELVEVKSNSKPKTNSLSETTTSSETVTTVESTETTESVVQDKLPLVCEDNFDIWFSKNFQNLNSENTLTVEGSTVRIIEKVKPVVTETGDLLDWAINNMRQFDFINFEDGLLEKSPRELTTNEDREKTFNKSKLVVIKSSWQDWFHNENCKIDYFMSHSWADDAKTKCTHLKEFNEKFKIKNNRNVTLWFDKVCINQADPSNALLTLPIFIGACNKLLVVIGRTYMKRLWCVWELFCLFCFCNTTLALDRIDVIVLEENDDNKEKFGIEEVEKELKDFDLDHAHCFDPNEELKLRSIIAAVGIEEFNRCVKQMANIVVTKSKQSTKYLTCMKFN